ncbi:hypothetical protein SBBP2_1520012 [Burkholderiales bacterium]|nr:hypothetical protein SBBP2_1520012 [Burkholderiales bacterium]
MAPRSCKGNSYNGWEWYLTADLAHSRYCEGKSIVKMAPLRNAIRAFSSPTNRRKA